MVLCPELDNPENGRVLLTAGRGVGARASYSCNSGFRLRADDVITRECGADGRWINPEPQCIREQNRTLEKSLHLYI